MLSQLHRIREIIIPTPARPASSLARSLAAIAMVASAGALVLACESGPTTTFEDTTGLTFVAFCEGSGGYCNDIQVTGDAPCEGSAHLDGGYKVPLVCVGSECRPIACDEASDCMLFRQNDWAFACMRGTCVNDDYGWEPRSVDAYCLRHEARVEECSDDNYPSIADPYREGGTCPYAAGDRRCVAYTNCDFEDYSYGGNCTAPTEAQCG